MHESIAAALYRGYARKARDVDWGKALGQYGSSRRKRTAWMKGIQRYLHALPHLEVLSESAQGKGKHATLVALGVSMEEETSGRSGWYPFLLNATARTFDLEFHDLPIFISHHLVQRIMQRLGVEDPRAALHALTPSIAIARWLDVPPADGILLPAGGGAVIAAADRDYPDSLAFVTFVDQAKLSIRQLREIKEMSSRAFRRLRENTRSLSRPLPPTSTTALPMALPAA